MNAHDAAVRSEMELRDAARALDGSDARIGALVAAAKRFVEAEAAWLAEVSPAERAFARSPNR